MNKKIFKELISQNITSLHAATVEKFVVLRWANSLVPVSVFVHSRLKIKEEDNNKHEGKSILLAG